jgi:hypothetical protein
MMVDGACSRSTGRIRTPSRGYDGCSIPPRQFRLDSIGLARFYRFGSILSVQIDSIGFRIDSIGFRLDSIGFGSILSVRLDSIGFWLDSIGFRIDSIGLARFYRILARFYRILARFYRISDRFYRFRLDSIGFGSILSVRFRIDQQTSFLRPWSTHPNTRWA